MSHIRNKQTVSGPDSWLCPHCCRREPYSRYLVSTSERIPVWEDRKQYWHRFSLGERPGSRETTNRLADGRLIGEQFAEQPDWEILPALRGCVHCHMTSEEVWADAEVYQLIAGDTVTQKALLQMLSQQDDTMAQWSMLPAAGIARRYGLCLDGRRWAFAVCPHPACHTEPAYRRELMDRLSREAAGYLLVLDLTLEAAEVTVCRELDRLVRLHTDQLPLKQKASVVLLLPDRESLQEHGRIRHQLGRMFPGADPWVVTAPEQLKETLPQAVRQLLGLNIPETDAPDPENIINADVSG